jgi:type I restriction enzyme R subunit
MVVCMSRRNSVKMYDALKAIEGCPEIASCNDREHLWIEWNEHRTQDATKP